MPDLERDILGTDEIAFAGYPAPFVYEEPHGRRKVQHLLWGDWVGPTGEAREGWVKVRARGELGWMRSADIQKNRLLEVNFVDVGQGDGCFHRHAGRP